MTRLGAVEVMGLLDQKVSPDSDRRDQLRRGWVGSSDGNSPVGMITL